MMGLHAEIRKAVEEHPLMDAYALAEQVVATLGHGEIVALVAKEIEGAQRAIALQREREAFTSQFARRYRTGSDTPVDLTPTAAFRALFASTFKLGDGTSVSWGRATKEQHLQRIEMLKKLRNGLDQTIAQHEAAILILEQSGADCLDDVPSEPVVTS